jgi:hypothetical protein
MESIIRPIFDGLPEPWSFHEQTTHATRRKADLVSWERIFLYLAEIFGLALLPLIFLENRFRK